MDIRDYLNRSNAKRDLSSSSKEDDEPKRKREESGDVSCLDSPTSPGKLSDLKDLVDFIFNKFDDFERDRLEKGKIITALKEEVTYLRGKVDNRQARTVL